LRPIVINKDTVFNWDESKNEANKKKHKVSFDEAITIFHDDRHIIKHDKKNSQDEDRFIALGISEKLRVLVVCHCYRESATVIRVISARKATAQESAVYKR
jgi:hypothetical protein